MEKKWIILTETICQGTIPAWFGSESADDEERPVVHDTKEEAYTEMIQEHIYLMQTQLDEAKQGHRDFEEIDIELQDWIESCTIDENGIITIESGELYNPKTYVR